MNRFDRVRAGDRAGTRAFADGWRAVSPGRVSAWAAAAYKGHFDMVGAPNGNVSDEVPGYTKQ